MQIRSFITTQPVKQLPEYLKEFVLDSEGWHLPGSSETFCLDEIDEETDYHKVFYKDRWIKEDLSQRKIKNGAKPLEQHLVVSFSPKYKNYQRKIRKGQIDRAQKLIDSGNYKQRPKNQNDPHRFIVREKATKAGKICSEELVYLDTDAILEEERYDGFYAVCTNLSDMSVDEIVKINKKRWEIEECFRIMKTDFKARPVYLQTEDHIRHKYAKNNPCSQEEKVIIYSYILNHKKVRRKLDLKAIYGFILSKMGFYPPLKITIQFSPHFFQYFKILFIIYDCTLQRKEPCFLNNKNRQSPSIYL